MSLYEISNWYSFPLLLPSLLFSLLLLELIAVWLLLASSFFSLEAAVAMGRKRNQGKARKKAANAKAREKAEQIGNNNQSTTNRLGLSLAGKLQLLRAKKCLHGIPQKLDEVSFQFMDAFRASFNDALDADVNSDGCSFPSYLLLATDATMDKFAEEWNDAAKIVEAMSFLLYEGAQAVLDGDIDHAQIMAVLVRYFEEHIAVELKQTKALTSWPKLHEASEADIHTLVTFFKKRIPCSCLDEKHKEVKDITKVSICYNPQCPIPQGEVERRKTMCCSGCRMVIYCSRECQKADWAEHKSKCGRAIAKRAEFEAKQQNM